MDLRTLIVAIIVQLIGIYVFVESSPTPELPPNIRGGTIKCLVGPCTLGDRYP